MSKLATFGVCAAGVIAVAIVFRALDRPFDHPKPVGVDTTPTPFVTTSARVETFELVAPPAPAKPAARRIEPRLVFPTPAVSTVQPPAQPDDRDPLHDVALLAKLHDLAASDPEQSLKLAREALERFPRSPSAPEFEWNVVKALVNLERFKEAKDEAQVLVRSYPDSDFTSDVERHLLNPQPNQ